MPQGKQEEKESEETLDSFMDDVHTLKEETVGKLYESLLESAYTENKQLREINARLEQEKLALRDDVALHCFTSIFEKTSDAKQAAQDAYRMADAFLRVRETSGVEDDKPKTEQ